MEEQEKEEREDIVVLDEGISLNAPGPEMLCCWGPFIPLRA